MMDFGIVLDHPAGTDRLFCPKEKLSSLTKFSLNMNFEPSFDSYEAFKTKKRCALQKL